jgi:hypothetical protein
MQLPLDPNWDVGLLEEEEAQGIREVRAARGAHCTLRRLPSLRF